MALAATVSRRCSTIFRFANGRGVSRRRPVLSGPERLSGCGGHLTAQARSSLFGGVIMTLIAAVLLLSLSWSIIAPAAIIVIGASLLITSVFPE